MLNILFAAFLSTQAADAATTAWKLNQGPRFYESNSLLPNSSAKILGIKAGFTGATAVTVWKIRKQHPKLAKTLLVVGIASGGFAAIHNARLK